MSGDAWSCACQESLSVLLAKFRRINSIWSATPCPHAFGVVPLPILWRPAARPLKGPPGQTERLSLVDVWTRRARWVNGFISQGWGATILGER